MPDSYLPSCLIVDDEENICLLLHDFLNEQICKVATATTKKEAIARIETEEFDLVLVDKNLPDGSGLDVAHAIRHLKQTSEIIVITGYSDLDSALLSFELDVYRYIKKPFDLPRISADITSALETRKLKKTLTKRTEDLEAANAELKRSESRFRKLANLLPGIVIETDTQGQLTFVNQTGLTISGCDETEFFERFNDHTLIDEADRDRWQNRLMKAIQGEQVDAEEYLLIGKKKKQIPTLMQMGHRENGGLRAVLLDISARRTVEKHLKEKEFQLQISQKMEAVGSLAGGVAHDFNNMLGVIRGFCDVLLLDIEDTHPSRDDIFGIIEAADRSAELSRQLLAFSKRQVMVVEVMDLNIVVQDMEKMLTRLLPEDIILETRFPRHPLYLTADRGQLEQVILNLVINARDAMPSGGTIEIETSHIIPKKSNTSKIRLMVSDSGVGMDEETRRHIFEPFFTTKEQGKGTGLGLATVQGIVTQFGGVISVESEPGEGTRFEVILNPTDALPSVISSMPPDIGILSGQETILVVENEDMLLNVVSRILKSYGYTVLKSRQGGDALLLCESHKDPIDLLLVDVVLPRMNGVDLASRLKQLHPEMAVLYMSGHADFALVQKVMSDHADRFISKPFSARTLATKVRECLAQLKRGRLS